MDSSPLISVIVVSYNHAHFVKKCLDSLLNQTYKNWELIIADDFSTDDSTLVIKDWLSSNNLDVKIVFHKNNKGLIYTLNECINISKGKYIKIIAADDIMLPELLRESVNALEKLPDDYMMVYSNARKIDENDNIGNRLLPQTFDFDRNDLKRILYKRNIVIALTVMMKKEVFSKLGFFNSDFIIEDYEYWIRISDKYKIEYINKVLGYYRLHSTNISKRIDVDEETVRIKMYYDKRGDYSNFIINDLINLYKHGRIKSRTIMEYKTYKSRSKVLYYFLKFKIPYVFYNLKNKLLYK